MPEAGWTFVGYHGTSMVAVPALLRAPTVQTGRNFVGTGQLDSGFYTTDDYPTAVEFARVATRKVGGYPAVLEVHVRGFGALVGEEVQERWWWRIADDDRHVTDFDYLTAPIVGYPLVRQIKFNPRALGALTVEIPR